LLRVVEEGRVTRIGAQVEKKVNVRVISTVNVEPTQLLEEGKLREDLFYRLCRISAYIPPLRDRKEDIMYLADLFIQKQNKLKNRQITFSPAVADLFMRYRWDGNVRELKNLIESASDFLKHENEIQLDHLSSYFMAKIEKRQRLSGDSQWRMTFGERVKSYERRLIRDALKQTKGNISQAAQELNMKRPTLQHKLSSLGIKCEKVGTDREG
jgi:arginine utilization regulatory protein